MDSRPRSLPVRLLRAVLRSFALAFLRLVYRIRVTGLENVPAGGALLVANHLTHVDAPLIGAALFRRRVSFLMYRPLFDVPVVGAFARLMDALPVAAEDTPKAKAESLARAAAAARGGNLVCIFAEGGISRSGALLPFARGLESIAREADVPIVPVALDRLWGSIFSFSEGRFFWKWPRKIPYPVEVAIGAPLSSASERWQVRDAVAELVARAREERRPAMRSLGYRFLRSARANARLEALVQGGGRRIDYRELLREVLALRAAWLRSARRSVAVRMFPGIDAAIAHLVAASSGAVVHALEPGESPPAGIELVLDDLASLRARVTARDRVAAMLLALLPGRFLANLLDRVRDGTTPAAVFRAASPDGKPRAIVLSHAGIATTAQSLAQMFRFGPGETVAGALPGSSLLGVMTALWIPLFSGGRVLILGDSPLGAVAARERPTVLVGTPENYRAWLASCTKEELASLRLCICGGAPLSRELAEAWHARFGIELSEGYGCTEMGGVVSVNLPGIESSDARQQANRAGTAGRAIPGVAVRVVDERSSEVLPPGTEGRLLARGAGRMLGILGEISPAPAGRDAGWIDTGDRAILDKDAFLVITAPRSTSSTKSE